MTVAVGKIDRKKRITIADAKSAEVRNGWRTGSHVLEKFLDDRVFTARVGRKDGPCITQGGLTGERRIKRAVIAQHILMLDHDTGMSIEDVFNRYEKEGLYAAVWATHSHGKSETTIAESALIRWCDKHNVEVCTDSAVRYLKLVKNYEDRVFGPEVVLDKIATDEGAKFRVKHRPMDRSRSLVVLSEPFNFVTDDVTQDERMKLWSEKYLGFAQYMGFHADASCVDPSRLMYLPSRPADSDAEDYPAYETETEGLLDLSKVETVGRHAYKKDKFAAGIASLGGGGSSDFKTMGLLKFVAKYGDSFRITDFFSDCFPDDFRGENGDKHVYACPNDDEHSNAGDPDDVAFFCKDADGERGFAAWCQHDGCINASSGDRVWFLDRACQRAQISDAAALERYADEAIEEQEAVVEAVEHRAALTADSNAEEIKHALQGVAKLDPLDQAPALNAIKKQTGRPIDTLRAALSGVVDAQEAEENPVEALNPKTYTGPIDTGLPFKLLLECTKERVKQKNREFPRVFVENASGKVIRVLDDPHNNTVRLSRIETTNGWTAYLTDICNFENEDGFSVAPSAVLINHVDGNAEWDLNRLDRVTNVPQLGEDGVIQSKEGYVPAMRCYLRPNVGEYPPLPLPEDGDDVWRDEVEDALHLILKEALGDFAFSDYKTENRMLPIYSEEVDESDPKRHPYPNLKRGQGSRANYLAMVLQGFARPAIGGSTPAYHIDKAAPATGGGLLTDTLSYVLTGKAARITKLNKSEEETQKLLTSSLKEHPSIIFFDNLTGNLDSPSLAAVLTSDEFTGRELGSSRMVTLPVKTIFVITGNNITFSTELRRRNVPIFLDSKHDKPERRSGTFKHEPLTEWLHVNRPALVRACLVLLANWVRLGKKPGTKKIASFEQWSLLMSGVFEAIDATLGAGNEYQLSESFLSTTDDYEDSNKDGEDSQDFLQCLWDRHADKPFTTDEAYAVYLANEDTHDLTPVDAGYGEPTQKKKTMSYKLTKKFNRRWLTLEDGTRAMLLKEGRRNSGSKFQLVREIETSLS